MRVAHHSLPQVRLSITVVNKLDARVIKAGMLPVTKVIFLALS
jgi:hypothetical protein